MSTVERFILHFRSLSDETTNNKKRLQFFHSYFLGIVGILAE